MLTSNNTTAIEGGMRHSVLESTKWFSSALAIHPYTLARMRIFAEAYTISGKIMLSKYNVKVEPITQSEHKGGIRRVQDRVGESKKCHPNPTESQQTTTLTLSIRPNRYE